MPCSLRGSAAPGPGRIRDFCHGLLARVTDDLNAERRDRGIERTHMQDAYESLRGKVVRRLEGELSLLKEGLHALRRDPPKVAVMDDHADRAIDGLTREINQLRRGGR